MARQVKVVEGKGCYCVKYQTHEDLGSQFSMDYNWQVVPANKNRWICSESPVNTIHWDPLSDIPEHGFKALLEHFGLTQNDIDMATLVTMSPADLARTRRSKERQHGLNILVMRNMRLGCPPHARFADEFEAEL